MIKRVTLLIITSVFLLLTMSACHTTKPPCPAYAWHLNQTPANE